MCKYKQKRIQMKKKSLRLVILATFIVLILILVVSFFFKSRSPLDVDVSGVEANVSFYRFDKDLFADYDSIENHTKMLDEKYADFFLLFTQQLIHIGHPGNQSFYNYFEAFLNDYSVNQAKKAVFETFPDTENIERNLTEACRHLKYYFPEKNLPDFIFFIAGFNHSVVTEEQFIGIGLDKYLGADSKFYEMMRVPNYAAQNMHRKMIPVDCMTAWFSMEFPNTDTTEYLIYQMIYEGQRMYFLDAMFPEVSDTLKMGYTARQLAYCSHFETEMWTYLVSEKLLFSTDYLTQRKFIGDAPFTAAFGNDSPGRAAVWIGWQIVRAWAKENKLSVQEVVQETDFQKILNQSYYDPK